MQRYLFIYLWVAGERQIKHRPLSMLFFLDMELSTLSQILSSLSWNFYVRQLYLQLYQNRSIYLLKQYLRRKQNTKGVTFECDGQVSKFWNVFETCVLLYSLKYLCRLKLHDCKYVYVIWMQTFDPILLLLIMDNSTFLYHVEVSSITQTILRSNYRIIFHN